jgi:glycosyltransferase involved in cell wall biosynthesis
LSQRHRGIPWIAIDNADEAKVANLLGESAIFLATSLYEGFGLPPLEAMACGCVVVGFHGYGGLEYARPDNGFWCSEGALIECTRTLARVVSLIDGDQEAIHQVREAALRTAGEFSSDRQERELIDFWEKARGEQA